MKENFWFTILGIVMIILVILAVIIWVGMLIVFTIDDYNKNPNSLFITIPAIILVHWFGYMTIKHTRI